MGLAGRAHVEMLFGMESVLDAWDEVYRDILNYKPDAADVHEPIASPKGSSRMALRVGE
jgi:hypothetical protein